MGSLRYDSQARAEKRIKSMQANHLRSVEPEDTLSLILMIKLDFIWNHGLGRVRGVECTNRRDEDDQSLVLVSQTWGSTAQY